LLHNKKEINTSHQLFSCPCLTFVPVHCYLLKGLLLLALLPLAQPPDKHQSLLPLLCAMDGSSSPRKSPVLPSTQLSDLISLLVFLYFTPSDNWISESDSWFHMLSSLFLFFFSAVLGIELRTYTLSYSTSCCVGYFEIGSHELFAAFKP
jgi:hypothetical protein